MSAHGVALVGSGVQEQNHPDERFRQLVEFFPAAVVVADRGARSFC